MGQPKLLLQPKVQPPRRLNSQSADLTQCVVTTLNRVMHRLQSPKNSLYSRVRGLLSFGMALVS
jgi:hypothetical protein